MDPEDQRAHVAKYYSDTIHNTSDLRTSACCPVDAVPKAHQAILDKIHPDVKHRFYGCGSPIPDALSGTTVLDLGCGTGRDAFLASALVGKDGHVIGLDMTPSQLQVARSFRAFHAEAFFASPDASNVDFRHGLIEDLAAADVSADSVDVVISNCVCNLCPDKTKVFSEVSRVLKPGGEFYFSDVYADRRLTAEAAKHPVLVGECLGGALYLEDFRRIMANVGFPDVRVVSAAPVALNDQSLLHLVPDVTFLSVTIRAFKLDGLADRREDYAHVATYSPKNCCAGDLKFDADTIFRPRRETPVDANTAAILKASRFAPLFKVSEPKTHRGLFRRSSPESTLLHPALDCFRAPLVTKQADVPAAKLSCCAPAVAPMATGVSACKPVVGGPTETVSDAKVKTCADDAEPKPEAAEPNTGGDGDPKSC